MLIKKIIIGGRREEVNKQTGEHTPNLIDSVKRSDLIFTPEKLLRKFFKGTDKEYDIWLMDHKLHLSQVNYYDIHQKQELLKKLKVYTMRLLEEAKIDSIFSNSLGNLIITKWLDTFDTLENHIYDFSDFSKIEFIKITNSFKKNFTSNSPFVFLTIDELNQQLKIVGSHKILLLLDKKLPMGNKRGTSVGQTPEKLYQDFFTTIGYKGKGELTEGLNYHRRNFKNFNFNLNIETRLLNDIIYNILNKNREEVQIAFLFGTYGKKLYFESDIKGTERKKEEIEALAIAEEATAIIQKELHKERQGSISIDKTSLEVKKRVEFPRVLDGEKKKVRNIKETNKNYSQNNISNSLKKFEKELFIKQQGYVELAKDKINEALSNRVQYIKEFYSFLDKGFTISDALNKFSERYANNPYIKGIIETSITGDLQLQVLKDKGIKELQETINGLKSENQGLKKDLDNKETDIATLNQNLESLIVSHIKELEEIEINVSKLAEERTNLINENNKHFKIIQELEKLIIQYEQTLKRKDNENKNLQDSLEIIKKDKIKSIQESKKQYELLEETRVSLLQSNQLIESLENDKRLLSRQIENFSLEKNHYIRQIEQLKEENILILSTNSLLKTSNQQLLTQLESIQDSDMKKKS